MPIRPEFRHLYRSAEWKQTRARILERAGHTCERCGKPAGVEIYTYTWQTRDARFGGTKTYHMAWVKVDGGKHWRDQDGEACQSPLMRGLPRRLTVRLTIAHVDCYPPNMADENLACWCTWCHLHHDAPYHRGTRSTRKDLARPLLSQANPN